MTDRPAAGRGRHARAWSRLGRESSLSLPVTYLFAPIGALGPLLVDRTRLGGTFLTWLAIAALGQVVVMVCFLIARRVLHRPGAERSRPLATIGVIVGTSMLRGLVLGVVVLSLGLAPDIELRYRVILSVPLIGGTLLGAALLVSGRDEHRALLDQLSRTRNELALLDATMQGRLAEVRERLLRQVRGTLEPGLRDLDEALSAAASGGDPTGSIASLREFVETDLRELSRAILVVGDVPADPSGASGASTPRTRWPRRIEARRCLWPITTGAFLATASMASALRDLPLLEAAAFVVAFGLVAAGATAAVRAAVRRWSCRTGVGVLLATVTGALVAPGTILGLSALGVPAPRFVLAPSLVVGAAFAALCALMAVVEEARTSAETELQSAVHRLQESISALRQHTWIARRRLSVLVHGAVQGVIHAAVIRLGQPGGADPATIAAIRRDVESALARLDDQRADAEALDRTLAEIAGTWSGVCAVTWAVAPDAVAVLDADLDRCECAAEIAREGVHNAVVHGGAGAVHVAISREQDRLVVRVEDDGRISEGPAGLGSRMLDDVCVQWSRTSTGSGTVLAAELSLAGSAG